jgi:hypothetical protein
LFPLQFALGNKDDSGSSVIKMPAEGDELYQKTLVRGKGHIVPEPVAQRRRPRNTKRSRYATFVRACRVRRGISRPPQCEPYRPSR